MKRSKLLDQLASQIIRLKKSHPTRVGIDGPDAAGKTTIADELAKLLQRMGRPIIRASIDGFHNPATVRYNRGRMSPEGYYYDSFNYDDLINLLLLPLGPDGSLQYRTTTFDYRTDSPLQTLPQLASPDSILLFDGVFLLRSELAQLWDFTVFVDAAFDVTLARAKQRDAVLFGSVEEVRRRYEQRYIPGQQLYFDKSRPQERANVVIDNNRE